ncbi:Dihydropteroate synthase [Candidatus Erwinia haradaeae]|uniref:Dihydropteroate synthase n=1 Tax=Candidatus Erwinia haradaeae TaxID=1922217 RepID=A0A451DKX4_9GAMM|nr:dihydropteroate synthase [Candidatus Erwinia haradaeae]VFP87380.1 Dihydropteroate synthase [Candidatus Erwinia haradaeae]
MKLYARNVVLDLSCPHIMGVLNATPDSFFDGGKHYNLDQACTHVEKMINAGATMIDIGGESTRPYALAVSVDQELARVMPIIESIVQNFDIWISVDTSKPEVMREAARAGVHMINDVHALKLPGALRVAQEVDLPICLVHMQGQPYNMQCLPCYDNVIDDVKSFFIEHISRCETQGIPRSRLLLDPGFGFGKSMIHNYKLLAHLADFHQFHLPLLAGLSRKSMISQLLHTNAKQCLIGSIACAVIAAIQGVHILRVHDVRETAEALHIVSAVRSAKDQTYHESM